MLEVFAQRYTLLVLTWGGGPGLLTPEQNLPVIDPRPVLSDQAEDLPVLGRGNLYRLTKSLSFKYEWAMSPLETLGRKGQQKQQSKDVWEIHGSVVKHSTTSSNCSHVRQEKPFDLEATTIVSWVAQRTFLWAHKEGNAILLHTTWLYSEQSSHSYNNISAVLWFSIYSKSS